MKNTKKDLIFGKNDTRRIVSIEDDGIGNCELFTEDKDGIVTSQIVPCKYNILFTKPYRDNFRRLKGEQHYKYMREYTSRSKYYDVLKRCSKKGLDVFTVRDPKEHFMTRYGYTYYKGMNHKDVSIYSLETLHIV